MSATAGQLVGGGRWITNPKHLPIFNIGEGNLTIKTAAATSATAAASGFWTGMALEGAATSITGADAYITVADLTGSGFMFSCVSPTHSANFTPTIRLTVDGTVYTFAPSAVFATGKRLVIGASTVGTPTISSAGTYNEAHILSPNSLGDNGVLARVGGINSRLTAMGIATEMAVLTYGLACLRFESALKIEMKASLLSGTANDKQCGALYRLDL